MVHRNSFSSKYVQILSQKTTFVQIYMFYPLLHHQFRLFITLYKKYFLLYY
ncbi:Protein of unknown function [Gryllus bimaculatus]|nr:Protein of unknown function [Gryllus bimaculatus]